MIEMKISGEKCFPCPPPNRVPLDHAMSITHSKHQTLSQVRSLPDVISRTRRGGVRNRQPSLPKRISCPFLCGEEFSKVTIWESVSEQSGKEGEGGDRVREGRKL